MNRYRLFLHRLVRCSIRMDQVECPLCSCSCVSNQRIGVKRFVSILIEMNCLAKVDSIRYDTRTFWAQ